MSEHVTIATFDNQPDAHIAKGLLEAEGIECWLADEHFVQMDWLYGPALGWIKLRVAPEQADRARVLLNSDHSDELSDSQS